MHQSDGLLWNRITQLLNHRVLNWERRISNFNQITAVERRERGDTFTNRDVFKGWVLAVLSNNTDWSKIESLNAKVLDSAFCDFDISEFSRRSDDGILEIIRLFRNHRAGSMTLRRDLATLRDAAAKLVQTPSQFPAIDSYIKDLVSSSASPALAALALGSPGSAQKLPGLGVPLAAEFLKNIGYDVAKPDRHINRAAGCFGWVKFRKWPNRHGTTPPTASSAELVAVMDATTRFAHALGMRAAYVDNAIWLLCARSGAYLSNDELSALAQK